mgnify:CR=1 FL=1
MQVLLRLLLLLLLLLLLPAKPPPHAPSSSPSCLPSSRLLRPPALLSPLTPSTPPALARSRERRQLTRTTADLFRLVPLIIILVRVRARLGGGQGGEMGGGGEVGRQGGRDGGRGHGGEYWKAGGERWGEGGEIEGRAADWNVLCVSWLVTISASLFTWLRVGARCGYWKCWVATVSGPSPQNTHARPISGSSFFPHHVLILF